MENGYEVGQNLDMNFVSSVFSLFVPFNLQVCPHISSMCILYSQCQIILPERCNSINSWLSSHEQPRNTRRPRTLLPPTDWSYVTQDPDCFLNGSVMPWGKYDLRECHYCINKSGMLSQVTLPLLSVSLYQPLVDSDRRKTWKLLSFSSSLSMPWSIFPPSLTKARVVVYQLCRGEEVEVVVCKISMAPWRESESCAVRVRGAAEGEEIPAEAWASALFCFCFV